MFVVSVVTFQTSPGGKQKVITPVQDQFRRGEVFAEFGGALSFLVGRIERFVVRNNVERGGFQTTEFPL